jgi:phospholipid/cholesterol/gamma-HCH transport system substrate-binding protein
METKANYVAVGIFVLACLLGLIIALLWLGGSQYIQEFAYYRTFFSGGVTGLGNGTLVRYNGIQVGRVSKVDFDPNDPKRVIVTLQVNPDVPIHADSVASVASEGLTGGSYVEIDGGTKSSPVLPRTMFGQYPEIRSRPSTLQQLEQSAPQLLVKINGIADRLNDVLSVRNRQTFAQILTNLRDVSGVLARHSADFDKTLKNIASASAGLDTDVTSLHTDLSDAHNLLAHTDVTIGKLNRLSDDVDKLSGDIDTQVNGARLDQLLGQTREMVRSLTRLSDELEHEPTRLIYGDRRKGYTPP